MKLFRIFFRSIRNAGKSIIRNFSLSFASVICTIITLILVSIGFLVAYNAQSITKSIENELTIVVFMEKDITKEELAEAEENLNKIDNVKKVTFNSKETIKNDMAEENETFAKIIKTWEEGENPLQDSYVIEINNVKDINETVTSIKNLDKVDLVKYGESMINELIEIFDFIKTASIVLLIGLIIVTAVLINNTIKITIFSRRNEINIMRLVGTSNTVIKLPFFIEGFFIGLIGSIVPILFTIFGYNFAYEALNRVGLSNIMNVIKLIEPDKIVFNVSLYLLIIGCIVGMLSSIKAVRKHLTI